MPALARSRPLVEIALPPRRRAIASPPRGREREPLDVGARAATPEPSDPLPLCRIGLPPPAVVPSSTAPAVAPPLPRDATAGGETAFAPALAAPDAALRLARSELRRTAPTAIVSALLLHAAMAIGLVFVPRPPLESGGAEAVTMIELIEPGAAETVDAVAGSQPSTEAARPEDRPIDPPPTDVSPPEPEAISEPTPVPALAPAAADAEIPTEALSETPTPVVPPPSAPPPREVAPTEPMRALAVDVRPARPHPRTEVAEAKKPAKRERRAATPSAAPPGNAAADRHTGGAATRAEVAARGGEGEVASWRAAVLAALARAKRYPEDARAAGRTGRAAVTFTIRRDGSVVGIVLAASSGVGSIDGATLDMPRRAGFPPMPAGAGATQTFTAGVRYDLH